MAEFPSTIDTTTIHDTVDAREAIRIVRELAARGPIIKINAKDQEACGDCGFVWGSVEGDGDYEQSGDIYLPTNHEPSCLWRRARALYP